MANIFINGVKSNTGGGKSILNNYLTLLKASSTKHKFFVLTPDKNEYLKYSCDFIEIVDIASFFKKNALFFLLYYVAFPKLLKNLKIDIIFNFGDIIIPTKIPQIYMFDWAYAVYPEAKEFWHRMSYKDFFMRKLKIALIKKYIKYPVTVIGQTKTICGRLQRYYGLNNVETIPSAVSLDNLSMTGHFDFQLPADKFKLLYLSTYSVHKNMEILIPLAKKIKEQYLPYLIIITVNPSQHRRADEFLKKIEQEKLESVILNLGHIEMRNVASLYNQSDALLMPTLLESYGLPFVEAMYHQKSILTSDLDFARDVCGEAAFYFDPLDENSIIKTINEAYSNNEHRLQKIREGEERINRLLSWRDVFERYQKLLELNINKAGK